MNVPEIRPFDLATIIRVAILHGRGYPCNPDTHKDIRHITAEDQATLMSFDPEGMLQFERLQALVTWAWAQHKANVEQAQARPITQDAQAMLDKLQSYVSLINMGGDNCGMGLAADYPPDFECEATVSRADSDEWYPKGQVDAILDHLAPQHAVDATPMIPQDAIAKAMGSGVGEAIIRDFAEAARAECSDLPKIQFNVRLPVKDRLTSLQIHLAIARRKLDELRAARDTYESCIAQHLDHILQIRRDILAEERT